MRLLLCIDDDPYRYRDLAPLLKAAGVFLVVHHDPEMVALVLGTYRDELVGVCLDHDMPTLTGVEMAKLYLIDKSLPVAITSANPVGAQAIAALLAEYQVPHKLLSASVKTSVQQACPNGWEQAVMEFFGLVQIIEHWTEMGCATGPEPITVSLSPMKLDETSCANKVADLRGKLKRVHHEGTRKTLHLWLEAALWDLRMEGCGFSYLGSVESENLVSTLTEIARNNGWTDLEWCSCSQGGERLYGKRASCEGPA